MKSDRESAWQRVGRASRKSALMMLLAILGTGIVGAQSPGTFTATGNMMVGGDTATLLPNGKVLTTVRSTAELYDPSTGTFTATGDMTTAPSSDTATLLPNGKVLIAGGENRSGSSLASAELYDPSTGTFTATATGEMTILGFPLTAPPISAFGLPPTATLLPDGRVLIAACGAATELYDPVTGTFSLTGAMVTFNPTTETDTNRGVGCDGPTATLLTNGKVLLAGGDAEFYYPPGSASAELYDPSTGTFTVTGKMTTLRFYHTATLLPDGTVLIAGGQGPDGVLASAELYDPSTGTFTATGSMITPLYQPTATVLPDGTVLVDDELYHPAVLVPAPVLFSLSGDGQGQGAILHASTSQVASPDNPASIGDALEIYCTGLTDGSVIPPQVSIGGRMPEVLWFGNTPGYTGLNQVDVRVPSGVAPGPTVPVRLTYLGRPSNEVTIGVR